MAVGQVLDAIDTPGQDVEIDAGFTCHAAQRRRQGGVAAKAKPQQTSRHLRERRLFAGSFLRQCLIDEAFRGGVLGVQKNIDHGAALHNRTGIQHRHAITDAAYHVHFVSDQHDGEFKFSVDLGQQLQHRSGGLGVECAGCLVAQQDRWTIGERTGNADALLLATRELRGILVGMRGQTNPCQQFVDAVAQACGVALAGQPHGKRDVVGHGLRGEQVEVLEDHADMPTLCAQRRFRQRGHLGIANKNLASTGVFEQIDQPYKRRFAGA